MFLHVRLPQDALAAAAEAVAARLAVLPALRELHVERLKLEIVQNEQVRTVCSGATRSLLLAYLELKLREANNWEHGNLAVCTLYGFHVVSLLS